MSKRLTDRKKDPTPPGGMTYEAIAKQLGITKQGVRRIEKRAVRKIKRKLTRMYGMDFKKIKTSLLFDPQSERD